MGKSVNDYSQLALLNLDTATLRIIQSAVGAPTMNIGTLMDLKRDGHLLVPEYQREPGIWSKAKKSQYLVRLLSPEKANGPKGQITMYTIGEQEAPLWLMDGLQRLTTIEELLDDPSHYGLADRVRLVEMQQIGIEVCKCRDHEEAMLFFQQVNMGTSLTPYEFHKGILLPWRQVIDDFYAGADRLASFVGIAPEKRRPVKHHQWRALNGVLYRYLSQDTRLSNLGIRKKSVDGPEQTGPNEIESRLKRTIEERGLSVRALKNETDQLLSDLMLDTETMRDIWSDGQPDGHNVEIPMTLTYLLWSVSVWRRASGKTDTEWKDWLRIVRQCYRGHKRDDETIVTADGATFTHISPEGETIEKVTIDIHDLGKFRNVCTVLGSSFHTDGKRRTVKRKKQPLGAVQGGDVRHIDSFAENGEGEIWYGPSAGNRAKGAEYDPMPYDEEDEDEGEDDEGLEIADL